MAYQSVNPATRKLLKTFDELTEKQMEEKLATAGKTLRDMETQELR
jgi:hypothetical protein